MASDNSSSQSQRGLPQLVTDRRTVGWLHLLTWSSTGLASCSFRSCPRALAHLDLTSALTCSARTIRISPSERTCCTITVAVTVSVTVTVTVRQTDNDCIFAGSSSPPCAARRHSASDSCLYGRRRSTLFGRASSLFLWVLQLDSTPLQHCNLIRLAVSHLMAALALHLDSMCRHSEKSSTRLCSPPASLQFQVAVLVQSRL